MNTLAKLWLAAAFAAALAAVARPAWSDPPFTPRKGQGTFLVLSDIHFDPFTAPGLPAALHAAPIAEWPAILKAESPPAFATWGHDANYSLFQSSLQSSVGLQPGYDFVVLLGDILSHDFLQQAEMALGSEAAAKEFAVETSLFVARQVQRRFEATPVVPSIGNNDNDCADYATEPRGHYLRRLAAAWDILATDAAARRDFIRLGSYSIRNPAAAKHRLVTLNTVFLSGSYVDTCRPDDPDPGIATLDWLETELADAAAAGDRVTLLMHVPPGFDGFASASAGACSAVPLWKENYDLRFREIVGRFEGVLLTGFAGHLHMDEFRVSGDEPETAATPIHVVPAISPIFGNNPAYTVVLYNRASGRTTNYAVEFVQLNAPKPQPAWRPEYKWNSYGVGALNAPHLAELAGMIAAGGPVAQSFRAHFQANSRWPISDTLWQSYVCALTEETAAGFSACRCPPD
jgi:sphingomyelin phosphodiesterase acid-like 3